MLMCEGLLIFYRRMFCVVIFFKYNIVERIAKHFTFNSNIYSLVTNYLHIFFEDMEH